MKCPHCFEEIHDQAKRCKHCTGVISKNNADRLFWIVIAIVLFVVVGIIMEIAPLL